MIDFLSQYGLFLAKAITLFLGIIFTVLAVVIIIVRSKNQPQEGTFVIESINERLEELTDLLDNEMLSKTELKAKMKARKKSQKKQKNNKTQETELEPKLFIIQFEGDVRASAVSELRETITAILNVATPKDEVLLILESGGGFVPHYGLAASQLARFRANNIPLTVAIDKIAASGGYLMACVANKIICAPFAVVGSIGVLAIVPNFHELLKKHHIQVEQHTAGQYKRTLTMFGQNNEEAREKFKEELSDTHAHFKSFIAQYRPQVDVEKVATGEHWAGEKAQTLQLVDLLQTSDDYILSKYPDYKIYKISFVQKLSFKARLTASMASSITQAIEYRIEKILQSLRWGI